MKHLFKLFPSLLLISTFIYGKVNHRKFFYKVALRNNLSGYCLIEADCESSAISKFANAVGFPPESIVIIPDNMIFFN